MRSTASRPRRARLRSNGADHRAFQVALLLRRDVDLGADKHVGAQLTQHRSKVAFRLAVAVRGRGVEVVDAEIHSPRHGLQLFAAFAAHH